MLIVRRRTSGARVLETSISRLCRARRSFRATLARRRELLWLTFASAARSLLETSIAAMLLRRGPRVLLVDRVADLLLLLPAVGARESLLLDQEDHRAAVVGPRVRRDTTSMSLSTSKPSKPCESRPACRQPRVA